MGIVKYRDTRQNQSKQNEIDSYASDRQIAQSKSDARDQ
jgi:hypothetical protein